MNTVCHLLDTLPTMRRATVGAVLALLLGACASTMNPAPIGAERIRTVLDNPARAAADRSNDLRRKPDQMLAFIGVRPGMQALDVSAAGGYTTELLARAIGPGGTVYGQPFDNPVPAELADGKLDLVTLMFNYHDFGFMGVDRAQMNRAVFRALKPGGMFVIADHAGRAGTGISESGTLHRVEEAFLRGEVEAAGFRLAARGDFLANPNDPRDRNTPNPPQPKDEFVLKFVKP